MAADLVKFRSGDNEKAQDETVVLLDPGQVLFGLTRKEDGSLFGSIWYDVFDDKYNIVQRVPMGGANAAGSYITGALSIADKNGHAGDQVVIADVDEATLLLPKHICAEYFAADTSFDITHSPFNTGESRQYGNGFVITHPSESKQEGWIRLIGEDGSKNTTLELATRDSYSKDHKYNQVVIRQYDGNGNIIADQDKLLREAILLGVNGETYFPGPVTSARGFIGDLTGHASSATKAQYDWLDNDIAETYFASVEEKVSKAAYQLDFANGAGSILKTIFMPMADAIKAGLITADRDHPQTLTGQKILDEYGGIQIKAPSGFDYKGIQGSKNETSTTIWFSKEGVQGTPVYDNTFTYDSKKHLLKVQNVEGLISNATADKENNQIDDHYFCYFETANDAASYTIWGMPDTGTKRDFHASPTGALEKNKLVKIVVPIATEDKAGIITADKKNPQYLAGTKYLQGSFILNGVDGQFIGQYYNKTNSNEGYWKLQGEKNDDSLLLETLTNAKNTYGKIIIQQKNGSNKFSKFELANIYGNTGLHSLSITDDGNGLSNTSPYVLYINTTRKGDQNQSYSNSVFINNIINTATTVYFGTMNGDSDALYYINDSNNPNAKKSTIVIKTGSTYQSFFAQFRSLYLDDDLYVGKGISNDGPLIQHGSVHLHDITHNHYFNGKKNDIEMGSWVTIDAKNTSTPNEVILTLGNKIAQGGLGNGQGFLRLYSHNNNYGQWSFNGQDFTPSHNIYFLNNYDKLTGWQNGIWGKVGKDDYWRVGGGATAESKGYLELSVANNNVESILVRKYADDFKNLGSGPDTKYEAALLDENGNTYFPKGLAINKNKSDSGYAGLSLYGDITNAQPMYGIIYRTMNGTSHGYTVDTNHYWATYFNIHSKTTGPYGEGWIFNNGTLDVASIDRLGNAQFNQICLNRRLDSSTQSLKQTHGRISWYSPTYYTWYDYMSEPSAGYAPTGAAPSKIGNVTSWARRSLIENTSGYGWVWESCQNKASEIPVAWLGLSANDGRLIMHGKEIYYAGSKSTISMIRWIENTSNNYGHGIAIGGGGITIIGSGESANSSNFAALTTNGETTVTPDNETLYLLSDSNIFLETNADSFSARLGLKIDTTGALIPVIAESPYDRGLNIGSPTARWSNIYANVLRLQGPSSNPSATAGARIEFTYDDGSSRAQPVYISYTPNDSYRAPYGLKIWGSAGTSYGAWLEVQGAIGTSNTSSSSGIGISLYGGPVNGKPTYGLFFGGTSTFGKYGTVQGDWATYFTMSNTTNRGWIFQKGSANIASIGCDGTITATYFSGTTVSMSNGWFGNNYLTSNWHGWYATSGNTSSTRYGYIQTELKNGGMMKFIKEQGGSFAFNSSVNIGSTAAPSYMLHVRGDIYANGGWLRTSGAAGWYNETYGGGWYMTDSNFIRNYNSKAVSINVASNNTWGIGTHRLAAVFKGNNHVSILLSTDALGYGLCVNNDGNWYWGKRTTSSETSTSGDSYILYGNTSHISPNSTNAVDLGLSNHRWRSGHIYRDFNIYGNESTGDESHIRFNASDNTQRAIITFNGNVDNTFKSSTHLKIATSYGDIRLAPANGNVNIGDGSCSLTWRKADNGGITGGLESGVYFSTPGRESVVFANMYAHTGWIFVNGIRPSNKTNWSALGVTPAVQIHHNALYINRPVRNADTSDYNLYVNGTSYFTNNMFIPPDRSLIQYQADSSNYTAPIKWYKGSKSQNTYDPQIGQHNTGGVDGSGSICVLPYATSTDPWGGSVGLYICRGQAKLDGYRLLTSHYAAIDSGIKLTSGYSWISIAGTSSFTCPDGTAITQPGGANPMVLYSGAASGRDCGIFYLSNDNAYIANSSDNAYTFGVFDTDITRDFSTEGNASLCVRSGGTGTFVRSRLGVNGINDSYNLYVNGTSLFGSTLTANGQIISKVASGTSPFVITSSTVNANLNADLLDGYHESAFLRYSGWWNSGSGQKVDNASGMIFAYSSHGLPGSWGVVTTFDYSKNSAYRHQIYGDGWNNEMYFRTRSSDKGGWNEWRHLLDSVNYTGTLDGRYVNVTGDTMTGNLKVPSIYASNWFRSTGATGWYSETYGGGIYMQDSTWVRVYNNKLFYVSSTNQSAIHTAGGIDARGEIRSFAANGFRLCYGSKPVIFRNDGSNFYILISNNSNAGNNWITPSGGAHPLRIDLTTGYCYSSRMYSAVWNDYAEYRCSKEEEPGRVVMEDKFGICHRATTRLQSFAGVVSDTFGFSQGETKDAKTPLAVAGRVLVYPYQDPSNYQPGDCVCAAPNGTVDIMTREEVVQWPDRIVGTVSEIPDYEVWSDGKVKVNGRIWIKVR